MTNLVFGCGYLGLRVARRWRAHGETVWAATRSPERAAQLRTETIESFQADLARPFVLPTALTQIRTVLFAVGFDRSPGLSVEDVFVQGLSNVLAALPATIERLIYVSSTGVYGQTDQDWVDEDSACNPLRPSARACLDAERLLAAHPLASQRIVMRMAGLYGPGRIPKLRVVERHEVLPVAEDGYLNLIHVEDAAEYIVAASRSAPPPMTLNVSDGAPVLRGEFYRELARLLDAPSPRFAPPAPGTSAAGRAGSDKRVDSRRLRHALPRPLKYPSYREGLRTIVAEYRGQQL